MLRFKLAPGWELASRPKWNGDFLRRMWIVCHLGRGKYSAKDHLLEEKTYGGGYPNLGDRQGEKKGKATKSTALL